MLAFVHMGLVPDGGSSLFVPSRAGFARAAELALLGERLDAQKALDWGLVNRVWPDEDFASQTAALLDGLASGATKSFGGTKRQLNRWLYEHMDDQLEFEDQIQMEMASSGDFAEGIKAFVEKRAPRFMGA
jgi:2-(1,2-epoxy-1,2-dihydrophenyl)acetyl-CoA isomerase